MTDRLFVYGTLAPRRPNEHVLSSVSGTWSPATIKGRLIQAGWGAELGCPGAVLDAQGDDIPGFVLCSEELSAHWARLDAFEGEGYERLVTRASLEEGLMVEAYVYCLKQSAQALS